MKVTLASTAAAAAAIVLTACGGGGGSTPEPVDAQAAHLNYSRLNRSYTNVTGTDSLGIVYRFDVQFEAPTATEAFPYNGMQAKVRRTATTSYANGVSAGTTESTEYFSTTSTVTMGTVSDAGCLVTRDGQVPPADAAVGDTGGLYNYSVYATCTRGLPAISNGRFTWSLRLIDNIKFYCLDTSFADSGVTFASNECYDTSADGTLGNRLALIIEGTGTGLPPYSLTAKNF
jgi:hypothetical protein